MLPKSAYATHILDNRHEYGTDENTPQLLQACQKGSRMDCLEALYIQALHQRKALITEQQVNDTNPLFGLASITPPPPPPPHTQTIASPHTSLHGKTHTVYIAHTDPR